MFTMYKRPETKPSPAGEKFVTEYEMAINELGHKSLVEKMAPKDIYTPIQESLEETKIENIIRRAAGGDESALSVHQGAFFDARNAPTSLAEAQAAIIAAENQWLTLPLEIRQKFDHSFEKYINDYGTESWAKIFNDYNEANKTLKQFKEEAKGGDEA